MGQAKNKAKNPAQVVTLSPTPVKKAPKNTGGKSAERTLRQACAATLTAAWIPALSLRFQGNPEALKTVARDAAMLGVFTADELIAREAAE